MFWTLFDIASARSLPEDISNITRGVQALTESVSQLKRAYGAHVSLPQMPHQLRRQTPQALPQAYTLEQCLKHTYDDIKPISAAIRAMIIAVSHNKLRALSAPHAPHHGLQPALAPLPQAIQPIQYNPMDSVYRFLHGDKTAFPAYFWMNPRNQTAQVRGSVVPQNQIPQGYITHFGSMQKSFEKSVNVPADANGYGWLSNFHMSHANTATNPNLAVWERPTLQGSQWVNAHVTNLDQTPHYVIHVLSNGVLTPINNVEAAYHAFKLFLSGNTTGAMQVLTKGPVEAITTIKKIGQPPFDNRWNDYLYHLLLQKFLNNNVMARALLGDIVKGIKGYIEGNTWHDIGFGMQYDPVAQTFSGEGKLGQYILHIRDKILLPIYNANADYRAFVHNQDPSQQNKAWVSAVDVQHFIGGYDIAQQGQALLVYATHTGVVAQARPAQGIALSAAHDNATFDPMQMAHFISHNPDAMGLLVKMIYGAQMHPDWNINYQIIKQQAIGFIISLLSLGEPSISVQDFKFDLINSIKENQALSAVYPADFAWQNLMQSPQSIKFGQGQTIAVNQINQALDVFFQQFNASRLL